MHGLLFFHKFFFERYEKKISVMKKKDIELMNGMKLIGKREA
jgi:hypothetical protein